MKKGLYILFGVAIAGIFAVNSTFAQGADKLGDSIIIQGTIFDENLNQAIPFANVVVESGTTQIASNCTGNDGKFTIKLPRKYQNMSLQITCSYEGYRDLYYTADPKELKEVLELKMLPNPDRGAIGYVLVCPPQFPSPCGTVNEDSKPAK